jgi:uncharacterized protein (DUF488 family)
MDNTVFTIGHSSHSMKKFLELLKSHGINAVADVRSNPYSRFNPQFNRENLCAELKMSGIAYVFLGRELGGRPPGRACYIDGKVQFDYLSRTSFFKEGLRRVMEGAKNHCIALLCAEEDPLTCHRTILVSRHLVNSGILVQHIRENGRVEHHDEVIIRLLKYLDLECDLFRTRDGAVLEAYERQGREIAYTEKDSPAQGDREVRR